MGSSCRVLLVDQDPFALESVTDGLSRAGYPVDVATTAEDAVRRFETERYGLLIADLHVTSADGLPFVDRLREAATVPPLLITGEPVLEDARAALKAGAADFLSKPFDVERLVELVDELTRDGGPPGDDLPMPRPPERRPSELGELIGGNSRMQRVFRLVRTVASASSTVLITGESGTGKERVAEAIHRSGARGGAAFVRINCSAFAEGVLESELFGHEQGAFTGATRSRPGMFRQANGGTLFLDEIGDIPLSTQVKLLRAIQEREVQPVGGDQVVSIDVRLIAATHRDLAAAVKAGTMREDLYFRLNVIPIHLPALRERPDDIPALAEHFLRRFAGECGRPVRGFTERAVSAMERYGWPGNVRELENAVERAVVLSSEEVIDLQDLPAEVRGSGGGLEGSFQVNKIKFSEVEEIVIRRVLSKTNWNIKRSAEMLGITRATLYSKIRKFGLAALR